jgi:hypothetical protein
LIGSYVLESRVEALCVNIFFFWNPCFRKGLRRFGARFFEGDPLGRRKCIDSSILRHLTLPFGGAVYCRIMARDLPDAMRMREIKYGAKANPAEQSRVARALLEAGRLSEALDLFQLGKDEKGIREIRRKALAEGRLVLLLTLQRGGGSPIEPGDWKEAGDAAFAAGRWREAFRCFTLANDEAGLARVREKIPDYEPYTPPGK